MILYHGTANKNLKISGAVKSRYALPCFFATPSTVLASYYAKENRGFIYSLETPAPKKIINYKGQNTYSKDGAFRNLIYSLYKEGVPSALITNAVDYPSSNFKTRALFSIVVIFDLHSITNIKRLN